MKRLFLMLLVSLFVTAGFAQQTNLVRGKVLSLDGTPISGAKVTVMNQGISTFTDVKGEFTINLQSNAPVGLVVKYAKFRPYVINTVPVNSAVIIGLDKKGKKAWHYILQCHCDNKK